MNEVLNRQRKFLIQKTRWRAFITRCLAVVPSKPGDVTVVFVSDRAMREMNRRWRGRQGTADVISFPAGDDEFGGDNLGDIVISVEQASRQSKENGLTLDQEISQLILHGLLHLGGYDHETDKGQMNRLELKLRRKLGIDT